MATIHTDEGYWATTATDTHYTIQFTVEYDRDGEWIVVDTEIETPPPPDPFLNHYLEE